MTDSAPNSNLVSSRAELFRTLSASPKSEPLKLLTTCKLFAYSTVLIEFLARQPWDCKVRDGDPLNIFLSSSAVRQMTGKSYEEDSEKNRDGYTNSLYLKIGQRKRKLWVNVKQRHNNCFFSSLAFVRSRVNKSVVLIVLLWLNLVCVVQVVRPGSDISFHIFNLSCLMRKHFPLIKLNRN